METELLQCATAGCGHSPFPMSASFVARARRTHETFYCPGGHSQHFAGKSREEKLSDEISNLQRQLTQHEDLLRYEVRRCPWIGCDFVASSGNTYDRRALWSHMRQAHGMPTFAEVVQEAAREEMA